jgi:glycosyltransferase involved in cell wall biosynthesis
MIKNKIVFVVWADHARRSIELSKRIGCRLIHLKKRGQNKVITTFYYIKFFFQTIFLINKEKPKTIIIEHTQPILGIAILLYTKLSRSDYILDTHTAPFLLKNNLSFWQKMIFNNCKLIIVHNEQLESKFKNDFKFNNIFTLEDPIPIITNNYVNKVNKKIIVTIINTYSQDEPLDNLIKCAQNMPDIKFYITGDVKKDKKHLSWNKYTNIQFVGFICDEDYFDLLNKSDLIVVLTTQDYTLLCGGYEGLSLQKPMILSDKQPIKKYYTKGVLFTNNSPSDIQIKILEAIRKMKELQLQIENLKKEKEFEWNNKYSELKKWLL